jgi:hypothetical protein
MTTHSRIIASTLVGLALAGAAVIPCVAQEPADPVGFQLLERLVVLVVKSAAPGGPGAEDAGQEIVALARDFKAAREARRVDDLFAIRFSRLLSAVRLAVLRDPEVLYWPMYRSSLAEFIEERTGRPPDWKALEFMVNDHGGAGVGLGAIADAVMSEVVSLHVYLETLPKRPDILQAYLDKGMSAAIVSEMVVAVTRGQTMTMPTTQKQTSTVKLARR